MATEIDSLVVSFRAETAQLQSGVNQANRQIKNFSTSTKRELSALKGLIGSLFAAEFFRRTIQAGDAMQKLNERLKATTGSVEAAAEAMNFLKQTAAEQKVDLLDLADGYTRLLPSVRSNIISMEDMREILILANDNIKAFGLSSSEAQGLFLGLSQALGSGTVTMEDLRQVTDRLPGSLNLMAQSLGLSVGELKDLVATGKVTADQLKGPLLEAFRANEGAAASMSDTFDSAMIDLRNGSRVLAEQSDLVNILSDAMRGFADTISNPRFIAAVDVIANGLSKLTKDFQTGIATLSIELQYMLGIIDEEVAGEALLGLQERIRGVGDAAQETAEKVRQTREDNGGESIFGLPSNDKLQEEFEKFKETLMSKEELENNYHNKRLEKIQEFRDMEVANILEINEVLEAENQRHVDKMIEISEQMKKVKGLYGDVYDSEKEAVVGSLVQMTQGVAQHNKVLFEINKVAKIAQILLNIPETISDAYRWGNKIGGPPLGAAFAAAAGAAQLAQLSAIKSTSYEGGGRGSAPSVAGSTPATPVSTVGGGSTPAGNLDVTLSGIGAGGLFTSDQITSLIAQINEAVDDGAVIRSITVS